MTQLELLTNRDLTPAARIVGWLVFVNPAGETVSSLRKKSGLGHASIYLRVKELEDAKLITGFRQQGDTRKTLRWIGAEVADENT